MRSQHLLMLFEFFSEELVSQIVGQTNDRYKYLKDHRASKTHSSLNNGRMLQSVKCTDFYLVQC
jgi:hypothetical protein